MANRQVAEHSRPVLSRLSRTRSWLAIVAAILVLVSLVPPVGTYARRYVFAEALQFTVFATVVPALIVLGAPWRPDEALRAIARAEPGTPQPGRWPRPPRGWDTHSA